MAKKAVGTGGSFFSPKDHLNALAILVEGKSFEEDVAKGGEFGKDDNGNQIYIDVFTADLTIFKTQDDLNGATEPLVQKKARIDSQILAKDGNEFFGTEEGDYGVAQISRPKRAYVWRPVDPAVEELVDAYYKKREAKVQEVKAGGIPDFLKG